jgi:hypothetical protein
MFCLENQFENQNIFTEKIQNVYKKLFWKIARKMTEGIYAGLIDEIKDNQKNASAKNKIIPV